MQSILITGSTDEARNERIAEHIRSWNISTFDRITPEGETPSIGIGDIRTFMRRLSLAPQEGNHVAGIIARGEKLTVEAQQALLKTLEEPPAHAYIIIGVPNTALLLPTIISRCICVNVHNALPQITAEHMQKNTEELRAMIAASVGNTIAMLSALGTSKEDLAGWTDNAIAILHHELLADQHKGKQSLTARHAHLLHAFMETKKYRENNVYLLLLLENAFLSLP